MDYYLLTDLAATMGYHLAMSGAETFRVEDTIHRILLAYGVECEVDVYKRQDEGYPHISG